MLQGCTNKGFELMECYKRLILGGLKGIISVKAWRKCMGIEPTRDGFSAPHRI